MPDTTRPLYAIARDIIAHWPNVHFAARPYLDAMQSLHAISDRYYFDTAESVVRYFLANAGTWRGDKARAIKAELKGLIQ